MTLTGATPSVTAGTGAQPRPAAATLALTATAPVVAITASAGLQPAAAALTLTAQTPSPVAAAIKTPAAAAAALAGALPLTSVNTVAAPAAALLSLASASPAVAWTDRHAASPAAAALKLTPQTLVALSGTSAQPVPATANLTLTAAPPIIVWTDIIGRQPTAAALRLEPMGHGTKTNTMVALAATEQPDTARFAELPATRGSFVLYEMPDVVTLLVVTSEPLVIHSTTRVKTRNRKAVVTLTHPRGATIKGKSGRARVVLTTDLRKRVA